MKRFDVFFVLLLLASQSEDLLGKIECIFQYGSDTDAQRCEDGSRFDLEEIGFCL